MKHLSFELTMPNVGSWNGKWTSADKKFYILKSVSDKFFKSDIEKLLEGETNKSFYYNFGDGWGANVNMQVVDATEKVKRKKLSKGFAGYDWMVQSILFRGTITTEPTIIKKIGNIPLIEI